MDLLLGAHRLATKLTRLSFACRRLTLLTVAQIEFHTLIHTLIHATPYQLWLVALQCLASVWNATAVIWRAREEAQDVLCDHMGGAAGGGAPIVAAPTSYADCALEN